MSISHGFNTWGLRLLSSLFALALVDCPAFAGSRNANAEAGILEPNDNAAEYIMLLLKGGERLAFALSDKPVIKMGDELTFTSAYETVIYNYDDVRYVYWDRDFVIGINGAKADGKARVLFRVTADGIEASGLANGERLQLYATDGVLMASAVSSGGGSIVLPLPGGKGTYIVRASSGISYKFIRK